MRRSGPLPGPPPQAPPVRPPVAFEYTGQTSLAVTGPITRATYRFPVPGARVTVDERDAAAVGAVPNVRRVASRQKSPESYLLELFV